MGALCIGVSTHVYVTNMAHGVRRLEYLNPVNWKANFMLISVIGCLPPFNMHEQSIREIKDCFC